MQITITITCDNEAFKGGEDNGRYEVARILRELARDIVYDGLYNDGYDALNVKDINGNTVGRVTVGE